MKTAIEKPVTPGGVFDHLMVPQGDEPEFQPSKDPKTMTVQESLEEVDRFLCWNRMTPEEKRAEQEAQRAASHATEQAAEGDLYTGTGEEARHPTGHGMGVLVGRSAERCAG